MFGSWSNTQKLAGNAWPFQLCYWDYSIGVLSFALLLAFTLGSTGSAGPTFLGDFIRAYPKLLGSAFVGRVIFMQDFLTAYSGDREQRFHAMVNGAWSRRLEG